MSLKRIVQLRRTAWTLPLAALAAVVIFAINETAYDRSTSALASLGDRGTARTRIQVLWRSLVDAETGQRGYLLTGRPEYLEPYTQAIVEVRDTLGALTAYYAGDVEAAPLMAEVSERSAEKLSELATTLKLHDQGRNEAWRELMLTDIGRERMESVRALSERLLKLETERVAVERKDVFDTLRIGRIGVDTMTALGLLALFLFLRKTLALDAVQRQHAAALQAERDQLEVEVMRRTADLTDLARHLQTAREDERSRLARELHDELGALLTAAKLDAARLKRGIGVLSPEVEVRLKHLNETVNRGIELKRRIIEDLRPSSLSNLGLVAALDILAHEFAQRSELPVMTDLLPVRLTDSAQITVFRLVQEGLTNIAKHASASRIKVTLGEQMQGRRRGARVAVNDDGRGFDTGARHDSTHGLMGMRYRIEAEGGLWKVDSAPGRGTTIEAWLPEDERPQLHAEDDIDRSGVDQAAACPVPAGVLQGVMTSSVGK
jgi:signal transduction histidine kinase